MTEPGSVPDPAAADREAVVAELHARFLTRRARFTSTAFAIVVVVILTGVAVLLPSGGRGDFRWYDRVLMVCVGLATAWFLRRFATTFAQPGEHGLTVRNVIVERTIPWGTIKDVKFGIDDPWVILRLADHDEQPVMAIQKVDGEGAKAEARRLATLVAYHQRHPTTPAD